MEKAITVGNIAYNSLLRIALTDNPRVFAIFVLWRKHPADFSATKS